MEADGKEGFEWGVGRKPRGFFGVGGLCYRWQICPLFTSFGRVGSVTGPERLGQQAF